jgi:hypothetical protein
MQAGNKSMKRTNWGSKISFKGILAIPNFFPLGPILPPPHRAKLGPSL